MTHLLAAAILALFLLAFMRRRLCPSLVGAAILAANIAVYYLVQWLQLANAIHIEHSYKYRDTYLGEEFPMLLTLGAAIAILSALSLRAPTEPDIPASPIPEAKPRQNIAVLAFVLACCLLTLVHAIQSNIVFLAPYDTYLSFRDPATIGVEGALVELFHRNLGTIGVLLGVILATSSLARNPTTILYALIPYLYILAFEAASISRWLIVQLLVPGIILATRSRQRVAILIALALLIIPLYNALLVVRNSDILGIGSLLSATVSLPPLTLDFAVDSLGNIFGGGLNIAEAARRIEVSYPLEFKLLSFSPFPSAWDGFDAWASHGARINIYGPFNAYAEAYWMRWIWVTFLLAIIAFSATANDRLDRLRRQGLVNPPLATLCHVLFYYGILLSTQYPLRSSLRWIVIAGIGAIVLGAYARIRTRREHRRAALVAG